MTTSNLWLCLHFHHLPVDVFCRHSQHEVDERAVVVLERQRVIAMNRQARALGIKAGSSMSTALAVSQQVTSFERDQPKELACLERLAQWAYQFSPSVSICAPDCLLLEIGGCLTLFKGLGSLRQKVLSGIGSLGFEVSTGVNITPLAALCSARADLPDNTEADRIRESLVSLPLSALGAEPKIIESLQQMGISRMKELLALPVDGLNRRFGVFFTDYLMRLTGDRPDPRRYVDSRPAFSSDLTFLSDVTSLTSLVFPLKRLLGELEDFLRARQLMVSQFRVSLSHRSHGNREYTVYLTNPDNNGQLFLALAQLQMEKINDMPEVDNISVTARIFSSVENDSGDLFSGMSYQQKDGRSHSKAEVARSARLMDMLTARLGRDACFGLSLANDHRPERAFRTLRLSDRNPRQETDPDTNPRPVYLLPAPKLLNTTGSGGEKIPVMSGPLELLQGPERIEYGWWDDGGIQRDYYIARHGSGSLYWVYQHLDNGSWFLHGIFS